MNKIFLVSILIFITLYVNGQNEIIKKNSEAKFDVLWTSDTLSYDLPFSIFVIRINNPAIDTLSLKDFNKRELLVLLKNSQYDWYINLMLYHITKRDAAPYIAADVKTRRKWIKELYDYDMKYWEEFLK